MADFFSGPVETLWWGAVIAGFAVAVVVVILLTILVILVRTIDRRVAAIRDTLTRAAENTEHTELINQTAAAVDAVLAEGLQHHLFLGRVLQKVRT